MTYELKFLNMLVAKSCLHLWEEKKNNRPTTTGTAALQWQVNTGISYFPGKAYSLCQQFTSQDLDILWVFSKQNVNNPIMTPFHF